MYILVFAYLFNIWYNVLEKYYFEKHYEFYAVGYYRLLLNFDISLLNLVIIDDEVFIICCIFLFDNYIFQQC